MTRIIDSMKLERLVQRGVKFPNFSVFITAGMEWQVQWAGRWGVVLLELRFLVVCHVDVEFSFGYEDPPTAMRILTASYLLESKGSEAEWLCASLPFS
jgi:hypothetical protein